MFFSLFFVLLLLPRSTVVDIIIIKCCCLFCSKSCWGYVCSVLYYSTKNLLCKERGYNYYILCMMGQCKKFDTLPVHRSPRFSFDDHQRCSIDDRPRRKSKANAPSEANGCKTQEFFHCKISLNAHMDVKEDRRNTESKAEEAWGC